MHTTKIQVFAIAASILSCSLQSTAQERIAADDMPQTWQYSQQYDQTSPTDDEWWRQFGDSTLDSLISAAVTNNYNVLMAQRRIEMARQSLTQARAGYFPAFNLSAGWNKSRTSGMMGAEAMNATGASYFNLGVDMSWQIDVFGKVTSRAKEAKANFEATRAEYDATMVTVAAKVASAYFQLRAVQSEIEVTQRHIASQKRIVEITEARHEAGLNDMLDVRQAYTTYYSTLATMSSLKSAETSSINALALLVGVFPSNIDVQLRAFRPMPDYRQIVAVGVPMELLRRRPDIAEAECTLAGYAAAVGIAKKDFLPTLTLNGSIGTAAHNIGNLFDKRSYSYSIAPTLSWTIFDGMSRNAAVKQAKEQMQMGIDNYNFTVLTAVQEVETAMSTYSNDVDYIANLEKVVEEAHEALKLSIDSYKQGLTDFINVTNAQITLLQSANTLVVAQGQALSDLVSLYEALGGGWQ